MWLSFNILSRMVDLKNIDIDEIVSRLTMSTAEIESIEKLNSHLESIITARILEKHQHPNADKLSICDIDSGKNVLSVICGAPNHKKGDIVAFAPVGTIIGELTIKKASIRGVESMGMLCSEKELGISDDHSGILILPPDTKVGTSLAELYPHQMDTRIEIDNKSITHRPDLWSHWGFAREIASIFNLPLKSPVDLDIQKELGGDEKLTVEILNPDAAPRYSGLVMKGIKIAESPDWLKAAVKSIGMRPINNIVDITNFVMAEIGEPMHAFDKKKLNHDGIIVRLARPNEKIMTLDGQSFDLLTDDIVIADKIGPIALAGIMGGGNSEIEENTTEIVLEAANFNPVNIRKTANRFNMRTEAAIRFEKSQSPELTVPALLRCYQLIKEIIPTSAAASAIIDAYPIKQKSVTISTTTEFIRDSLGDEISNDRIVEILKSLDFHIKKDGINLLINVPFYRATKDISIPEDIVEEVGRIFGYDNIRPIPPAVPCAAPKINGFREYEREIKTILSRHCNMTEISGYSFTGEDALNKIGSNEEKELKLRNPLSIEHDRLRRSLVQDLTSAIASNQRYFESFKIYELGRVYLKHDRRSPDLAEERTHLCGAIFQKYPAEPVYYSAKAAADLLLQKLMIKNYAFKQKKENIPPYAHPYRTAAIVSGSEELGIIYEFHPSVAKRYDINGESALFNIDVSSLFTLPRKPLSFNELQKYPDVTFEISIIAGSKEFSSDIIEIIRKKGGNLVKSIDVIDIYEGKPIPEDKKSVSIRIVFASPDRTLTPEEIDKMQNGIIKALAEKNYPLR